MKLKDDVNYIVSGLERSGTSMLMQILKNAEVPVEYTDERPSDKNNPKGYYELAGGKIINLLMEGKLDLGKYKGCFIKITAYGLKFLPPGNYKVIYSERKIDEIMDSMEKMTGEKDPDREDTKKAFIRLNKTIKNRIKKREDIDVLFINYNQIVENPDENIEKIRRYLDIEKEKLKDMKSVVDKKLYRHRRK